MSLKSVNTRMFVSHMGRRGYHKSLKISEEVREALSSNKPIVSLESTIITHGLPLPSNIEMAQDVEKVIRDNGCIPATIAFVDGVPTVGCSSQEIEYLAHQKHVNKCSRRDIAPTMAYKLNGGTTISGTMVLSHMAGINVFATGGLGGVHKGGELSMDVSADLEELGRTPVAVVCAGPKAILDIPRTMEYLETKGCTVATMRSKYIPGFYTRNSGVSSPYTFDNELEAARIIKKGLDVGLNSGYLFCIPPPEDIALNDEYIKEIIDRAETKARNENILGKNLTPFLLSEIAKYTNGASVKCNIDFVLNNAFPPRMLSHFLGSEKLTSPPILNTKTLVIGSVAIDTHCKSAGVAKLHDSNPGQIKSALGGVGFNIALASHLSSNKQSPLDKTRLVASVGKDFSGESVLTTMKSDKKMDTAGIYNDPENCTAQYVSMHNNDGELVVACADMDIATKIPLSHIEDQVAMAKPKTVVVDANVSVEILQRLVDLQKTQKYKLIFEPTSSAKSCKVASLKSNVYPENEIYLVTPTFDELEAMHTKFSALEKFNVQQWFPVLDALQIDKTVRMLAPTTKKHPIYQRLWNNGVFQKSFQLLPYFSNIIVKDGKNGVSVFSIRRLVDEFKSDANLYFCTSGTAIDDKGTKLCATFEHYNIPFKDVNVKNVTGAGDTFLGVLVNEITSSKNDIFQEPLPDKRKTAIMKAQHGSKLSIEYEGTISSDLAKYIL
ncbi:hypothetical protein ACO0QE_001770 [Hanseniaspora vineae]